ncbi:hypothetical protein D9757_003538 [Collybiopsis confluens]|uniref:Histone deacetylase domain-containing protein n=1 Tax=Collybiopsis confluens TaxID=2823264 RepID=A0A8H5HU12_9AGAR|nr:hypothetical protein D9757_003538 [Collybiopsis confluens]
MTTASIFIQDLCYQHRYIRSKDTSLIVERPERLVAVKVGLAAAITRIQQVAGKPKEDDSNDLVAALDKLTLNPQPDTFPINIVHSSATLDLLQSPAVLFTHAFPDSSSEKDPNQYLKNLKKWSEESAEKISKVESEIPKDLAQGDLYLCPESLDAIQGALGTVCESVDAVFDSSSTTTPRRAFVAIRPPGHHCGEDTPSGFCFVNNVIVGAAHAHLKHRIRRVVIFDIDLHHGNGTQSLVWAINEETQRQILEAEAKEANTSTSALAPGPQIYYSSLHDILSYPCEDGTPSLVQAASVSISGAHGQWVENVHLQNYNDDGFWDLYEKHYKKIIRKAEEFIQATSAKENGSDDVLVLISCGLDASEHEHASMSRHGRKVPTTFYAQFTKDARIFADKYANGRMISVLEGGYSDRALSSGTFAHFCALGLPDQYTWDESWWDNDNLDKLQAETKAKKPRGRASGSLPANDSELDPWAKQTLSFFHYLEPVAFKNPKRPVQVEPSSRTLRQRKAADSTNTSVKSAPVKGKAGLEAVIPRDMARTSSRKIKADKATSVVIHDKQGEASDSSSGSSSGLGSVPESIGHNEGGETVLGEDSISAKKLPRVTLKLGPKPNP